MAHQEVPFIGRKEEKATLHRALTSAEAELVAVIGRRRVGKTFLVRTIYREQLAFEMTGLQRAPKTEQLQNFVNRLNAFARPVLPLPAPDNWLAAFQLLIDWLETRVGEERIAVFLDELPWMATPRSGFLRAFGYFWNSWASQQNVVVVICGSAASWMIQKVVRNKGGLYNRITRRIYLKPFNLYETQTFLASRNVRMDHYQILQLYMAMGGIPHYLKEIEGGKSAVQNIDRICFAPEGLLNNEFSSLYPALFDNADQHIKIIRALAEIRQGVSRQELIAAAKLPNGGGTTKVLDELLASGFVSTYYTFGKRRKDARYRLTDEYSLFYLKYIEDKRNEGAGTWQRLSQTQTWQSWSGYAFESICLKHIVQIKQALGIDGIYSEASTYSVQGDKTITGFQIDLVLDRNDHVINVFELKFYRDNLLIDKGYADKLRKTVSLFRAATRTKKQLHLTLLTTFPIIENQYSRGLVDQALTMNVLFRDQ